MTFPSLLSYKLESVGIERVPKFFPVRKGHGDERPKAGAMMMFTYMTELVHDDVVGQVKRQKAETVVEIEVSFP